MSGSKKGDGKGGDDSGLWEQYVRDIAPIPRTVKHTQAKPPSKAPSKRVSKSSKDLPLPKITELPPKQPPQLDARTETRLRRGQMPIDARIDLHGRTQEQAHKALNNFLIKCYNAGMRCVLVITGKGNSTPRVEDDMYAPRRGVLKQMLPLWLSQSPLNAIVLKSHIAQIKDGGEGAYYIYLKRKRD